ncbi:MAG: hypothetical protein GX136_04240 [Clostridiales bacterium]|nr:hypothetical protein [Clostridiales bacterium]
MDDLAQKLSELLSSPDGLQKLQSAAASLGIGNQSAVDDPPAAANPPAAGNPDLSPVSAALPYPDAGGGDYEAISKLLPLVSRFKQDNQDTMLLKALRPYLQDERRHRLDDTLKIMQMLKVLPLLKDKGIF